MNVYNFFCWCTKVHRIFSVNVENIVVDNAVFRLSIS